MVSCQKLKYTIIFVLFLLLSFGQALFAGDLSLQKPKVYTSEEEITGWVMSEKLDGIRGYWNGTQLLTRKGLPLNPPSWFIKKFPPFELDGELWSKRGDFEFIQSTILDKNPGNGWEKITYNIFEAPNAKGGFLSRLNKASTWFEAHKNIHIRVIPQIRIENKSDLDLFLMRYNQTAGKA